MTAVAGERKRAPQSGQAGESPRGGPGNRQPHAGQAGGTSGREEFPATDQPIELEAVQRRG